MSARRTVFHGLCALVVATSAWAAGGSGTADDPYVITDVHELQAMRDDLAAHYVLGNDIDASETALWNGGRGFEPVGPGTDPFTGELDGQGHVVTGLHINRPAETGVGLLSFATGATIRDVHVEDAQVSGNYNTGILIGRAHHESLVIHSSATGTLTLPPGSSDAKSGGLIGGVSRGARVDQCFSDVEVFASNRSQVGGLVGYLRGVETAWPIATITNSYAAGTVHGNGWKQGNLLGDADNGRVDRSYSSGPGKALIGFNFRSPVITNSYWDAERGAPTSLYGGAGRTTAQMMRRETFVGWDFEEVWGIHEGASYPYLRFERAIEVLDPDYRAEEYVTIEGPSFGMTFDAAGNLYVLHRLLGRITKVTPERQVSVLTTIPPKPNGDVVSLIWTGGSAFGEFLYAFRRHPHSDLVRIDPQDGTWTAIASIMNDCGTHLGLDRVGLYGGHLYSGTGCNDRIFRLTADGGVSVFSAWPYATNGGGPRRIDFDPSGRYGGFMYIASHYAPYSSHMSGIFRLDAAGNATRFAEAMVSAFVLLFAPAGPMFDQEMFVYGQVDYSRPQSVWRVSPEGIPEEFVRGIDNRHPNSEASQAIAFGADGALYVAQHFPASDETTVHRVFSQANRAPVALCSDVAAEAGPACAAEASVDAGSYDPDGDEITLTQEPPGPYGPGVTEVELTVSDGQLDDTCTATVMVEDLSPPAVFCNAPPSISPPDAPLSFTAVAVDNCGAPPVFVNTPHCFKVKGVCRQEEANCRVRTGGPTLILLHPGGVGTTVQWLATAVDMAGNGTAKQCSVEVVPRGRCLGQETLELVGWIVEWNQSFESCNTITAADFHVLPPNGDVTFRAGEAILLGNGFQVDRGCRFAAQIEPGD